MDEDRGRTLRGEPFVLFKDNTMLIFGTDANLRLLASSEVLFMDGTFKSAPSLFNQLFTIHAVFLEHFITLVYCLLPDKQRATYHKVFDILKTKLAEVDLISSPDTIWAYCVHQASVSKFATQRVPVPSHLEHLEACPDGWSSDAVQCGSRSKKVCSNTDGNRISSSDCRSTSIHFP